MSRFPYIYYHFLDSRKFKISNSEASIDKDRVKKKTPKNGVITRQTLTAKISWQLSPYLLYRSIYLIV